MAHVHMKPEIHYVENHREFVGIKIEKDCVKLYVPAVFREHKNFRLTNKDLLKFLSSISLAKTIDYTDIKTGKNMSGVIWPIDSYLWIIKDYIENGYYYSYQKVDSKNFSGKINWKKTMRTIPIYSNGNIIYDKLITSKMIASNDIVSQIYKICLKQAVSRIGWAFNFQLIVDAYQQKTKNEMVYIINKELFSTFDDIKRLRFKHMLRILEGIEKNNALTNYHTYGIDNYYYVFEIMIDMFFKGLKNKEKRKYNPYGEWHILGYEKKRSSSLRPDTVHIKNGNNVIVIDAKMYLFGVTHCVKDLPNTESIQKQLTYGDYLYYTIFKDMDVRIYNVFILPYNKEINTFKNDHKIKKFFDGNLVYIGYAKSSWREEQQTYDKIYTFLIDYNFLLNNYTKDLDKYIDKIFEIVQS